MKAIYLTKYGTADKAFEVRETPIPTPQDDEVIIKVHSIGLNFADVVARRGLYPDAPKNPAVLGYDVSGWVHETGSKVGHVSKGDRVTALTRFGGYCEYAATSGYGVSKIADSTSFEEATALSTQACTAYYCLCQSVNLDADDTVLIHAAAGGVGSIMTQIAKHKGSTVIGTASSGKQDFLRENGVDFPIDYTSQNFKEVIINKYGKKPLDFVFDSIGGSTFKKGMSLLKPSGAMVTYGAAAQMKGNKSGNLRSIPVVLGFGIFSPLQMLMQSQSIIGVNMLRIADNKPQRFNKVLNEVIKLSADGVIKPRVSKVFSVDAFAEAHQYLEERKSIGKVVVNW
jgi:NADPH2:quinone reductase